MGKGRSSPYQLFQISIFPSKFQRSLSAIFEMGSFINLKGSPGWTAAALAALGFPSKMPQIETEEF